MPLQQPLPLGANGTNIQIGTERIRATEANRFELTGTIPGGTYTYTGPVNTWATPWPAVSVQTGPTGLYVALGSISVSAGGTAQSLATGLIVDGGAPQVLSTEGYGALPITGLATGVHTFQLAFAALGTSFSGVVVLSQAFLVVRPL